MQFHSTDWQTEPFRIYTEPGVYSRNLLQERFIERYWEAVCKEADKVAQGKQKEEKSKSKANQEKKKVEFVLGNGSDGKKGRSRSASIDSVSSVSSTTSSASSCSVVSSLYPSEDERGCSNAATKSTKSTTTTTRSATVNHNYQHNKHDANYDDDESWTQPYHRFFQTRPAHTAFDISDSLLILVDRQLDLKMTQAMRDVKNARELNEREERERKERNVKKVKNGTVPMKAENALRVVKEETMMGCGESGERSHHGLGMGQMHETKEEHERRRLAESLAMNIFKTETEAGAQASSNLNSKTDSTISDFAVGGLVGVAAPASQGVLQAPVLPSSSSPLPLDSDVEDLESDDYGINHSENNDEDDDDHHHHHHNGNGDGKTSFYKMLHSNSKSLPKRTLCYVCRNIQIVGPFPVVQGMVWPPPLRHQKKFMQRREKESKELWDAGMFNEMEEGWVGTERKSGKKEGMLGGLVG
jgi:hypothetical protein